MLRAKPTRDALGVTTNAVKLHEEKAPLCVTLTICDLTPTICEQANDGTQTIHPENPSQMPLTLSPSPSLSPLPPPSLFLIRGPCNSNKLLCLLLLGLRTASAFAHSRTIALGCRCRCHFHSVLGEWPGNRLAAGVVGAAADKLKFVVERRSTAGGAPFLLLPPLLRRRLLGLQTPGS